MQNPTNPTNPNPSGAEATEAEAMIGTETSVFAVVDAPTHQPTQAVPTVPASVPMAGSQAPAAHVPVPADKPSSTRWMFAAAALGICGFLGAGLAVAGGGGTSPSLGDEAVDAEVLAEIEEADSGDEAEVAGPAETTPTVGDEAGDADDSDAPTTDADDSEGGTDDTSTDADDSDADTDGTGDDDEPGDDEPGDDEPGDDDPGDPGDGPDWVLPGDLIPLPTIPPWNPPTDFGPFPTIPEPPFDFPEDVIVPTIPPGPDPLPPVLPGDFVFQDVAGPGFGFDS